MLTARVLVAFCQAKVNNVDSVLCCFSASNQKIVRFDVSVNYPFLVNLLYSIDLLNFILRSFFNLKIVFSLTI